MRVSSPKCWRFTSSTRSSFARPGPVHPKVRSVRRSDGSTEWWPRHRPSPRRSELSRATSSRWCSANFDNLAANAQTLAASRRLREALKSCSQRHLIYSMPRNYWASQPRIENSTIQIDHVEGYTDLEWPINARNRRNVLCACFSHAQTRPEITPYSSSSSLNQLGEHRLHNTTPRTDA